MFPDELLNLTIIIARASGIIKFVAKLQQVNINCTFIHAEEIIISWLIENV